MSSKTSDTSSTNDSVVIPLWKWLEVSDSKAVLTGRNVFKDNNNNHNSGDGMKVSNSHVTIKRISHSSVT